MFDGPGEARFYRLPSDSDAGLKTLSNLDEGAVNSGTQ